MTDFYRAAIGVGCFLLLSAASIRGAEDTASTEPFVAAFDRFGRHGEIDEAVAGELLISELSCTVCHRSTDAGLAAKRGPKLDSAGTRLSSSWIATYLAAPHTAKPGTTMPDVMRSLSQEDKATSIQALVAFLSTQIQAYPALKAGGANPLQHDFWNKGDGERGRKLYHEVGCVACHDPDSDYDVTAASESPLDRMLEELDPDELADLGLSGAARRVASVPHGDLKEKYTRQALAYFLIDPLVTRPSGRMPNLKLTPDEAADIAEYLLDGVPKEMRSDAAEKRDAAKNDSAGLVTAGKMWFVSLRCINCHDVPGIKATHPAKPLDELNWQSPGSCLGDNGATEFRLDVQQRVAIIARLSDSGNRRGNNVGSEPSATDDVSRVMFQNNCYACHERDGLGGVGRFRKPYFETVSKVDLGDEGRLPPPLTGIGFKATPAWLERVFKGDADVTLRRHMTIRMPVFSRTSVANLPIQLALVDQADDADETEVLGNASDLAIDGKRLMDIGCIQCHAFDGEALPGVIGIDISGIATRVRPRWFHDFVMNPIALKARTRMPTFFPDGKSQHPGILNGDAERQIAAMWSYLVNSKKLGAPDKIAEALAQDFELIPTDQPIILRTFLNGVGTHAIAVGNPNGMHFAFDAKSCRLAIAWKGKFLDARSTWYERMAPSIDPLGDSLFTFDHPSELADATFRGYRLDASGVPTFDYLIDKVSISDRIEAITGNGLKRVVDLSGESSTVAALAKTLARLSVTAKLDVLTPTQTQVTVTYQW